MEEQVDPVVLESVRVSLSATDEQLRTADADVELKRRSLLAAEKAREELADKRDKLAAYLLRHGDSWVLRQQATLQEEPSEQPKPMRSRELISSKRAAELAADILRDGKPRKAPEIMSMIESMGFSLPVENPPRRLTQIMSASQLFEADRTLGWRLKDVELAAEGQKG